MQTKHFRVSTVLFVTLAISLSFVRGQDCNPLSGCNEQSFCVPSGYCSCLSGFSGDSCLVPPQSSCASSYKDPNGLESSFESSLEFSLTLDTLNIQINASLEKNRFVDSSSSPLIEEEHDSTYSLGTTITWSGTSECGYPSSTFWTKAAVVDDLCLDSYSSHLKSSDAISSCGFVYDPKTNTWSNSVTITRYYSLPPDMTIMERSRRVEGHPRIAIESSTSIITIPSAEKPDTISEQLDTDQQDASSHTEEAELQASQVKSDDEWFNYGLTATIIASIAGAVGVGVIVAIIAIVIIRRRRSRKAQAQFNFEGIESN